MAKSALKTHILKRTGQASLSFQGEEISQIETSFDNGHSDYSGRVGIAEAITLYRVSDGMLAVSLWLRTLWDGQQDTYSVEICGSASDVRSFLEGNDVAPRFIDALLDMADIVDIDSYPPRLALRNSAS
ncbi:hypothetical protein E7T06_05265 [Deinococcus sp. Arct2-2]|uniref:hypothetical protein n=1 Tax=Deinococcus sp. Arct2-2 TaxID=2568653 RepID=UPI0010A2DB89|nr:hypothetical protein [Deinococcus sp. Arct2-2]THF70966.1 hypothetical protein E7T06_05265 [Deinococcus sp. Arct2-2]